MENIIRTLVCGEQVSLTLADTTELVRRGKKLHNLTKGGAETLGKFLSAAAFMSAALKEESGEISFALQCDGEGQLCNVSGNHALNIRGYLENAKATGNERSILGNEGSFTVIRDDGYSRPFVSAPFSVANSIGFPCTQYNKVLRRLRMGLFFSVLNLLVFFPRII